MCLFLLNDLLGHLGNLWLEAVVVGFLSVFLHPLGILLLFDGFTVLHEEVFGLLIVDPSHIFGDFVDHRSETILLVLPLILLASGSLDHARNFCLPLHTPSIELLTIICGFAFATLAHDISLIGRVVLAKRSTTVKV